jgi:general stress protein YciG
LHRSAVAEQPIVNASRRAGDIHQRVKMAKEDRGFASMDRTKQHEIASKGGKAAHLKGTAHEWTSEEAREAGRKGGMASRRKHRQEIAQDSVPEHQRLERINLEIPLRQDWPPDF